MSDEPRSEAVRYWWEMAEESLAAARRELDADSYRFAINRIYYAAFYAVSAVLLSLDLTFRKHSGVRAAFHLHLVKDGLLGPEWANFYDQLFEDRHEGDYLAFVRFDREYVAGQLARCSGLLDQLRPILPPA